MDGSGTPGAGAADGGTPAGGGSGSQHDAEGLLSFLEGAILGDFSDNATWSRIGGQTVVGFIPVAGQVADLRDTLAAIKGIWDGNEGAWGDLGLAAIAWAPAVGDWAKGALRIERTAAKAAAGGAAVVEQGAKHADEAVEAVKPAAHVPFGDRLPRTKGTWQGIPGESAWKSDIEEVNDVTGGQPIQFKNGYPDFAPWSEGEVELPDMKGTDADFGAADALYASQHPDQFENATAVQKYRQANELTWHHHEDQLRLQLIPRDLHGNIPHAGGASLARDAQAANP